MIKNRSEVLYMRMFLANEEGEGQKFSPFRF